MVRLAVELRNVIKKRHSKTIGPINLELPEGHIIALVGQNGSGKSTLLSMLLKLALPEEGTICWFGSSVEGELPIEIRRSIGYVPESPIHEESHWTPEEAASFRRRWYPDWDQAYFQALLDEFEVPQGIRLGKMSKGERRKFEIAAVLAAGPKLLLLDEPSSGLDPFAWRIMIETLQRYMDERQATIIISTHIVEEVRRLADYIILLHKGKLLGMAEKDALLGAWSEVWVSAADEAELAELAAELPEALELKIQTPGMARMITSRMQDLEKRFSDLGIKKIRSRILDLEEILSLWTMGHRPELADLKRGD
ncbi:ABC-2 type transport system ATP-binding protein [Paenibacillus forsythiae]|uniref:ABC-2 type transport system ATP-binding protein n=1 Tax=Paenibacillus forsythiae TaxID=365616 RepID=A0ABU3HCR8_9BACL|nr:ABC transporter ATP-binding protein [Paenibacillus forsythiae]MDT3428266.1 ABC-2 type transport system ATP-binding protein [Paenibacillus forsythiae]